MRYTILYGARSGDCALVKLVQTRINDGWRPTGGVSIHHAGYPQGWVLMQAMVREVVEVVTLEAT